MGTLFIVATPIGNLEDITFRAVRVLGEVSLIAAEDTRTTRKLLSRYGIATPLISFHEHSPPARLAELLEALEKGDVALVSEAGMPAISDPGLQLVRGAIARGMPVVPVPGPSAPIAALSVAGMPADAFLFLGFLPARQNARRQTLEALRPLPFTLVLFEAPHRLTASLRDMLAILGDRPMAAARELTKIHEEVRRGTISEILRHFEEEAPRGEFTLVIAGADAAGHLERWDDARVSQALQEYRRAGMTLKDAARRLAAQAGRPRREVYQLGIALEEHSTDTEATIPDEE